MTFPPDTLRNQIEKAIEALAGEKGQDLASKIRSILYANLDRKRLQKIVENNPRPDALNEYVTQVSEKYEALGPYIHSLQIEKSDDDWRPLLKTFQKWAYRYLLRHGFPESRATWENAEECASEAARSVLKAYFPFDTDFEPWARVVVQNTCLKFIRRSAQSPAIVEENLDELESYLQTLSNKTHPDQILQEEDYGDLFEAISQLTILGRRVIEMKYFQDLSPNEIASELGKSVRAVYSLQFRALQDLRKNLSQIRNKSNE